MYVKNCIAVIGLALLLSGSNANAAFMVHAAESGGAAMGGNSIYTFTLVGMAGDPTIIDPDESIAFFTGLTGIDGSSGLGTIDDADGDYLYFSFGGWTGAGSLFPLMPTTVDGDGLDLSTINSVITVEATSGQDLDALTFEFTQGALFGSGVTTVVTGTTTSAPPPGPSTAGVPEPSSFAMMGLLAAGGFIGYRRRKNKAQKAA